MGRVSITRTIIPLEYDRSSEGFNKWAFYIRNQVHCPDKTFNYPGIIPEINQILKYHTPSLNRN